MCNRRSVENNKIQGPRKMVKYVVYNVTDQKYVAAVKAGETRYTENGTEAHQFNSENTAQMMSENLTLFSGLTHVVKPIQ